MGERAFEAGERALLVDGRGRRYLIVLGEGREFHTHMGALAHDALIGAAEGSEVRTTSGARLVAFRPTLADFVLKMKRGAQVLYPKDIAMILVHADIRPGARVLEAGTGSGSLTLALMRAVGESGYVVSYELRGDHLRQGRDNIEAWYQARGDKPDNIDLREGDIFEGVGERDFDRLVLDLPEPWRAVPKTIQSLLPGGIMCCYVPTVPQVSQTVDAMRSGGFGLLGTFEALVRTWHVEGQSVRPDHRMVAHTGFVITGRKLAPEPS